jgi:hypothetical protein
MSIIKSKMATAALSSGALMCSIALASAAPISMGGSILSLTRSLVTEAACASGSCTTSPGGALAPRAPGHTLAPRRGNTFAGQWIGPALEGAVSVFGAFPPPVYAPEGPPLVMKRPTITVGPPYVRSYGEPRPADDYLSLLQTKRELGIPMTKSERRYLTEHSRLTIVPPYR